MQTPDVPDKISFASLQELMENAPEESNLGSILPFMKQVVSASELGIDLSFEQLQDPLVHKVMALTILVGLARYVREVHRFESDAAAMSREDYRKLERAHELIMEVPVHNRDFTSFPELLEGLEPDDLG